MTCFDHDSAMHRALRCDADASAAIDPVDGVLNIYKEGRIILFRSSAREARVLAFGLLRAAAKLEDS